MNFGLPKVQENCTGNRFSLKSKPFSEENISNSNRKEFMFKQGRGFLCRSRSDGEVIHCNKETEETRYSIINNPEELPDKHPKENFNPTEKGKRWASSTDEVSNNELAWVVLPKAEFLGNCAIYKKSRESLEKPHIDRNQNMQQSEAACKENGNIKGKVSDLQSSLIPELEKAPRPNYPLSKGSSEHIKMIEINRHQIDSQPLENSEEGGKVKDENLLIVLDTDGYQKEINFEENQENTQKSSINLEENKEDVYERATFYIGSRPNSGKSDKGSKHQTQCEASDPGKMNKNNETKGVSLGDQSDSQRYDFYDDIEVIVDDPVDRNEEMSVDRRVTTEDETSPLYGQIKSGKDHLLPYENNVCDVDNNSLLLPIVSELLTLPQPNRMERPLAIRVTPFCPFECPIGQPELKEDVKIGFSEWIGSRYNCGEKINHLDNTEINLISLSSSSESNCSDCDSEIKEASKGIKKLDKKMVVSDEDLVMACQCLKPIERIQLTTRTHSPLYTVKSFPDLSYVTSEVEKCLNSQQGKYEVVSETTTPPLLIDIETNPQMFDVADVEMKSDFHSTRSSPERSESIHLPTPASLKHDCDSYTAINHIVPTKLCNEKVHLGKYTATLNEASSTSDYETVIDLTSKNDNKLGTHLGENVPDQSSREIRSISDGVDPDLIHFFTHNEAISHSPPMNAVSGSSTNTSADNEVAHIMNTGSDDYVIEFKSESSNDWTISSAESDEGNKGVSIDYKNDKNVFVERRQVHTTSPESFEICPTREFLVDIGKDNIYRPTKGVHNLREDLIEKDQRTIKIFNDNANESYSKDEQAHKDEGKRLISSSPFKPQEKENITPQYMNQAGDVGVNESPVKVSIDNSIDRYQNNKIELRKNVSTEPGNRTNGSDKLKAEKPIDPLRDSEDISKSDLNLEQKTESETLLEMLPSIPCDPPTDVIKYESLVEKEGTDGRNDDSDPAVRNHVTSLTAFAEENVQSVTYPELDIFAKARLRQGGLHHWEMNSLLTELSREQDENKRLVRDSKRAMQEFMQIKTEVENILSKFDPQICVDLY